MCTSLTLKSNDGKNFLARTMDFTLAFDEKVHLVPRDFSWYGVADKKEYSSKYAVLGMSIVMNNHPIFADGVNEKGLTCATLYFPGFAKYEKELDQERINIAPYDYVYFILSSCENLEDVKRVTKEMSFIDLPLAILGITPPLHWIVGDKNGNSIVIENTVDGLEITDNTIGVMTNSPDIKWHFKNLRQFIGINPVQHQEVNWSGLELSAFSQGSGTFGMPGDYTPSSRFVRAAYLKSVSTKANNEEDAVTTLFHILSNCEVPKGAVLKDKKELDYTLYTSVMCNESLTYYYKTYE
ncbi:MAG: choloylglycine hydrolase family protein, partial [Sarcina sp.]